ncbi:MAG: diguanylate cyclase [Nitrospirota bacterium]
MEFPDIDSISSFQIHLSKLTGFHLSIYGLNGNLVLPPAQESRLLTAIRSTLKGRDDFHAFIKRHIEKTSYRNTISFFKGPANQYYFFAPLRIEKTIFILTGSGGFISLQDFEEFYKTDGPSYGLLQRHMKSWYPEITVREYPEFQQTARHIHGIFRLVLGNSHRLSVQEKRYRLMKTILSLIADMKPGQHPDDIRDLLIDVILFLFSAESVSVMSREKDVFIPIKAAGRFRDHLQAMPIRITGIMSDFPEKKTRVHTDNVLDLLRMGFPDDVTSFHAFPIISDDSVTGLLGILNSDISQEDADILLVICRVAGFVLSLTELHALHNRYMKETDALNSAARRLNEIKEPEMLYEAILDASVGLTAAEKGSLMLAEDNTSCLTIKAARGIHKRLYSEVKIQAGEGIAGKVFSEGIPLVVDDIERKDLGLQKKRPKYRTGSFISIPLKSGEKTIGVLNISDKITGEIFSHEDLSVLCAFASYASIALERSNYYSLAGHLKELSITDPLTGLFNRRYFEERFFEELHRSERHTLSFSLAMLDIDDFKLFNDTEGHLAGDEVLKHIANIAKDCLRVSDVFARFGGEEFAIIMPQTEKEEAFSVAERIRQSIKEQLPKTWKTFPRDNITISIGLATFPFDGKDRKELIRNADRALYRSKMEGKDRTVVCSS